MDELREEVALLKAFLRQKYPDFEKELEALKEEKYLSKQEEDVFFIEDI